MIIKEVLRIIETYGTGRVAFAFVDLAQKNYAESANYVR